MESFTVVHHIVHTVQAETIGDAIRVSRSTLDDEYWNRYADDNSSSVRIYGQDG